MSAGVGSVPHGARRSVLQQRSYKKNPVLGTVSSDIPLKQPQVGDKKTVLIPCLLEEAACGERWNGELQPAREGLADSFSGIVLGAERPYLLKALGWVKMSEAIFCF